MSEIELHHDALAEKIEWSKMLATSTLLPKSYRNQPGNLLFAAEYADSLGVSRINAITSIHVIEGKPSASADLMASLVRRAGHKLRIEGDDTYAAAHLIRADDPDFTYTARWDMKKARAAGVAGKQVWQNYPGAMLRARAITEVCRMGASEALLGVIYTPEELGAEVDVDGEVVHTITTVPKPSGADRMRGFLAPEAEPEPEVAQVGRPVDQITPKQVTTLGIAMRGMTRDEALDYVARVIGREVESRKDLTKSEASKVIDSLEGRDVIDAEVLEDNADEIWNEIVQIGEQFSMTPADLEVDFTQVMDGLEAKAATSGELQVYLTKLQQSMAAAS